MATKYGAGWVVQWTLQGCWKLLAVCPPFPIFILMYYQIFNSLFPYARVGPILTSLTDQLQNERNFLEFATSIAKRLTSVPRVQEISS